MSENEVIGGDYVNLIVGGMYFSLLRSDIEAQSGCYLASAVKDVWNSSKQPIVIDRDGILFQYIYVYLFNCRHKLPFIATGSLELMVKIRREADYYNIPELVALYNEASQNKLQSWCKSLPLVELCDSYTVSARTEAVLSLDELVSQELYPNSLVGEIDLTQYPPTLSNSINLQQLLSLSHEINKTYFQVANTAYCRSILNNLRGVLPTLPGVRCLLDGGKVHIVKANGSLRCKPDGARSGNCIASVMYILNSPYTGGVITVSRNGVSKSITKPGQYIMYTSEHSYEVSKVTSGALVIAIFSVVRRCGITESTFVDTIPRPALAPYPSFPSQCALVDAVQSELNTSQDSGDSQAAVVLCLSTLYPIVEFDPTGPFLETDPDSLQDRDALLYNYLKDSFEVTLVIVWVQRHRNDGIGCVLGPSPGAKVHNFAPFHNFRGSAEVSGANDGERCFVTLYTAMHITTK